MPLIRTISYFFGQCHTLFGQCNDFSYILTYFGQCGVIPIIDPWLWTILYLFIHIPKHNGQFRTFCINPKYLQLILTFCNTGASQTAILSNIKPFRGCPHITAAAGGEGFVNADVSRGEGKSIIILPDVIVCGGVKPTFKNVVANILLL